jgi:hypothetical protein
MWANKTARERFRDLNRLGLKGSGDYGVITVGGYNGQGLNRYDSNRNLHTALRLAYPFQLESGQYFELGLSGYQGKFVPGNSSAKNAAQYTDRRAAANFVWYPQPFGMEAEWTYGEGPESVIDYDSEGRGKFRNWSTASSNTSPYRQGIMTTENLHGGYVMFNYKADTDYGTIIPFTRWSYFDGARKFVANSPSQNVNEIDFGIEYQPWPCFEIALVYTRAFQRTNTAAGTAYREGSTSSARASTVPSNYTQDTAGALKANQDNGIYNLVKNVDRVTLQCQFNF